MSYRISVIIPIYNVEQYIEDCLDSIVNQSIGIDHIEVILVNDQSTDNSLKIAERYANRYQTIKIVNHVTNLGSGSARNTGLNLASSDFIAFVDGDDFISDNTFEIAMKSMSETNSDLFIYEYEYYSPSNTLYPRNPSAKLFSEDRSIVDILQFPEIIFATSVCNKVFKKELIGDLKFAESRIEDVMFSTITTFRARKISISNNCKYFYRKREQGKSKTDEYYTNKASYLDHLDVNVQMHQLIKKYPEYKELIDWFNARSLHPFIYGMLNNNMFSFNEKKAFYNKSKEVLAEVRPEIIDQLEKPISKKIVSLVQRQSFLNFYVTKYFIRMYNLPRRLFSGMNKAKKLVMLAGCLAVSFFFRFNKKYKNVWLICERGNDARDNGFSFYKYLREKHPEVNAYYLIDNSNVHDLIKVKSIGPFAYYGGYQHKILFILAKYLVTAHRGTIEPWNYQSYRKYFSFISKNQKYIFLQHGITKDDVSNVLGRLSTSFDLFITGAKPEYEYINSTFGYKNGEVVYTGFARFDDLYEVQPKKQILLMPTWRKKLAWSPIEDLRDSFIQSEYYRRYQSLISNEALIRELERTGFELIFYPHHEMQQFINCFSTRSDRIVIAEEHNFDVQALLKESAILITDYSSVFFDFGYMDKPVLYYQFDSNDFFKTHYKQGYFSYELDGFGPVLTKEDEVVNYLKSLIHYNCHVDEVYRQRIEKFFTIKDRNNCERIYESIIQLK